MPPVDSPSPTEVLRSVGPLLFDAVLFDLDGTLVATDRFWIPAARAGARRAFAELGLERELPPGSAWMTVVGDPLAKGVARLFPELDAEQCALLVERCVEEEEALLAQGRAALLPGVRETLTELRARGVRLAVASHCTAGYLAHMLNELGLAEWIEEARCLDSPGVRDKADMLDDLLLTFDTRSAVMVGDRASDRDAAWANGLPHVHFESGFAPHESTVAGGMRAEAALQDMRELVPRLAVRGQSVRAALDELGAFRKLPPAAIGVTGKRAAGKTLFTRDAARLLAEAGVPYRVVDMEDHRRADAAVSAGAPDPLARGYDVDALQHLLEQRREPGEVLLLEGPLLLDARLRTRLDRLVYLDVEAEQALRRASGREGRERGTAAVGELRERRTLELQFEQRCPPRLADLVLEASNPLGPFGRPGPEPGLPRA